MNAFHQRGFAPAALRVTRRDEMLRPHQSAAPRRSHGERAMQLGAPVVRVQNVGAPAFEQTRQFLNRAAVNCFANFERHNGNRARPMCQRRTRRARDGGIVAKFAQSRG